MSHNRDKKKLQEFMARAGGLLGVTVIGLLLIACGLTLAFGLYGISKQLFILIVALLIAIQVIFKMKS